MDDYLKGHSRETKVLPANIVIVVSCKCSPHPIEGHKAKKGLNRSGLCMFPMVSATFLFNQVQGVNFSPQSNKSTTNGSSVDIHRY